MKKSILILTLLLVTIPLSSNVFAESIYDIKIPSGSADSNAPFHWSSEKDGDTSGFIEIIVNDTIHWKNGDTVAHTITSGTPRGGPDGIFDSGEIEPGGLFPRKFSEVGKFPFYCTIHPWREGLVSVVSGYSVLPRVAADVGDGLTTFDIEYKFNRILNQANIDEKNKSINLELKGKTINEDNTLILLLPSSLISGISSVTIDGTATEEFNQVFEDDTTVLEIRKISPSAKSITIKGATIIPEFKEITFLILVVSIIGIIIISKKKNVSKISIIQKNNF